MDMYAHARRAQRLPLARAALALLSASSMAAQAWCAVVPDDYATIQAALDAQPDSVIVRSGVAPEAIVISHSVAVAAWPGAVPRLAALTVAGPEDGSGVVVDGFHVLGPVRLVPAASGPTPATMPVRFQACRMDSGLTQHAPYEVLALSIRGCTVLGSVYVRCNSLDFSLNTLIGGGLGGNVPGGGIVESNFIKGPAAAAVEVGGDGGFVTRWNVIRGAMNGIVAPAGSTTRVEHNRIEDCTGTAVIARSVYGGGQIVGNTVRRCGAGLDIASFRGPQDIAQNDVRDCDGTGIRVASDRNTPTVVAGNVAAGCGGAGFDIRARGLSVTGNTSALNGGSGFVLDDVASIDHCIGFQNQGWGVEWLDATEPPLACNDWFGNGSGAVSTGVPGASDLAVNPLFCDVALGDFHLYAASPVANAAGCGLIGALDVGCSDPPAPLDAPDLEETTLELRLEAASANPARGPIALDFVLPRDEAVRITVHDIMGREVAALFDGTERRGRHRIRWDGGAAESGVYFVRLVAGTRTLSRTITLTK